MMHVRIVPVRMRQRHVDVSVGMRFASVPRGVVGMLMVSIMRVGVRMFQSLV